MFSLKEEEYHPMKACGVFVKDLTKDDNGIWRYGKVLKTRFLGGLLLTYD